MSRSLRAHETRSSPHVHYADVLFVRRSKTRRRFPFRDARLLWSQCSRNLSLIPPLKTSRPVDYSNVSSIRIPGHPTDPRNRWTHGRRVAVVFALFEQRANTARAPFLVFFLFRFITVGERPTKRRIIRLPDNHPKPAAIRLFVLLVPVAGTKFRRSSVDFSATSIGAESARADVFSVSSFPRSISYSRRKRHRFDDERSERKHTRARARAFSFFYRVVAGGNFHDAARQRLKAGPRRLERNKRFRTRFV